MAVASSRALFYAAAVVFLCRYQRIDADRDDKQQSVTCCVESECWSKFADADDGSCPCVSRHVDRNGVCVDKRLILVDAGVVADRRGDDVSFVRVKRAPLPATDSSTAKKRTRTAAPKPTSAPGPAPDPKIVGTWFQRLPYQGCKPGGA